MTDDEVEVLRMYAAGFSYGVGVVDPAPNPGYRILHSLSRCIRIHHINQNERFLTSSKAEWDISWSGGAVFSQNLA